MDDVFNGADTINECKKQIRNVEQTFAAGKLELIKWMTNNPEVLSEVAEENRISAYIDMTRNDATVKSLGVLFCPAEDVFSFRIKKFEKIAFTKRELLSMMKLRMMIQALWTQKLD